MSRASAWVAANGGALSNLRLEGGGLIAGQPAVLNIAGATPGSALTATGLPAGWTLNSAARTLSGMAVAGMDATIILTETLAGKANSPNKSVLAIRLPLKVADYDPVAVARSDFVKIGVDAGLTRSVSTPPASQTFADAANAAGMKSGTAFDPEIYNANPAYAALIRTQADVYTAENAMKEGVIWTGPTTYDFSRPDAFMAIANADGKQVRGHVLFYPVKGTEGWQATGLTSANWQDLCDAYLQAVLTRPSLQAVDDWDVCNEIIAGDTGNDGYGYITGTPHLTAAGGGDNFLQFVLKRAAFHAPTKRLSYCDSNVEFANDGYHNAKRTNLLGAMARALDAGCRIDSYAMQCHLRPEALSNDYRNDQHLLRNFCKSLMALGIRINITEIDVQYPAAGWSGSNREWDKIAAEYVYQVVYTIFDATYGTASFPAHISTWGLSDLYTSWRPLPQRSHPFDAALNPKTMFTAIRQVLGGFAR